MAWIKHWFLKGWQILVFRQGPQDLPSDTAWTLMAGCVYVISGAVLLHLRALDHPLPALLLLDLALTLGFIWLVLGFTGRQSRLPQSLQAIWLCGAWLNLMGMPLATVLVSPENNGGLLLDLAVVASLALVFWSIALLAHILRHALDWSMARALLLSLAYTLINITATFYVFPPEL
ncbi:hypothetical protein VCB98_13525 [Gammaproteobacteria bacterium AB-CW1]|uniref:Yip1 domain-containing protein n=1 Tax=Natronospira elongata TaxID=3110268 RepID=A0AAP6JHQ8_9GAMM|nr:hypothetical protein [Gammaproteobacteria bacterium AB-CW1]